MLGSIKARNYAGLNLESRILEGMTHLGAKPETYARGFSYIFKRPIIFLAEEELKDYIGSYEIQAEQTIYIDILEGQLAIKSLWGGGPMPILALESGGFSFLGNYHDFEFYRDSEGNVTGFKAEVGEGYSFSADKL